VLVGESAGDLLAADPELGEVDRFGRVGISLGCGGLAGILMPSAVKAASKELVNWPARSLVRNLAEVTRWPGSIRKLRLPALSMSRRGTR
jgi:hypothetical protein